MQQKDKALHSKSCILTGRNKETHKFSLSQETENSSVHPLPALSYGLTLNPMRQN